MTRVRTIRTWLSADPNITDLLQREHLQILPGIGLGYGKLSIFDISAALPAPVGVLCLILAEFVMHNFTFHQ